MKTIDRIKEYYDNARLELNSKKWNQIVHKITVMKRMKGFHNHDFELNSHAGNIFFMIVKK